MSVIEGTVAFSDLQETEKFNGQDTGKYTIVLNLEKDEAKKLEDEGISMKVYKNTPQRKFSTKFPAFDVLNVEGEPVTKHIPYGSKVRLMYFLGKPHPTYGIPTYFKKIKVLEYADPDGANGVDEEDF